MADEWIEYVNDTRTICKYGVKCYQKNPDHHKQFKHPPKNLRKDVNRDGRNKRRYSPYTRESPRQSPKPQTRDDSPKPQTRDDSPSASEEKPVNDDSDQKTSDGKDNKPEEPKLADQTLEESFNINLPEDITYYDKSTDNSLLKELFLVEMPEDFFKFFECISEGGKSVEETLASVNLMPIGPYELLMGKLPKLDNKELYLIHWRFFFDPAEFQAVLKKKKNSAYHIGYFRDDPEEKPAFVASNDCDKDYHITPMAYNIFGAVYVYLQNEKKHSPFTAMSCQKLMDNIKQYAEEHKISLEEFNMKKRLAQTVTRSFHGAGIVVPYNKKTQVGYRRLVETDANLRKLFASLAKATDQKEKEKLLSDLQPVITYASIALDESDFGTGLEVGIALFCSGLKELEPSALSSFTSAYFVLNRKPFGDIIQAHLKYRRKGPNVSMLHLK
nr:histone PARylation factor 1 [Helicoverpa armigera]